MVCFVASHYTAKAFFVFRFSIRGLGILTQIEKKSPEIEHMILSVIKNAIDDDSDMKFHCYPFALRALNSIQDLKEHKIEALQHSLDHYIKSLSDNDEELDALLYVEYIYKAILPAISMLQKMVDSVSSEDTISVRQAAESAQRFISQLPPINN